MEFHTLTRRELQALCKKNKIPANITNAAMVKALKALEIVEGVEEFSLPSQSETAQSSIDSLEGSEVTSPCVPPTGGRTTRRRNVMKEEPEEETSVTATRRTTRRTAAKASNEARVDIMETPAFISQTSRRKGQMASACRKMDSQLKECVEEEEKKDVSMTPAPLGNIGRKKRVEVGTVQKVYSTRRSVRLAEKNVDVFNDEKSQESALDNELLTKDGENHGSEVSELVSDELLAIDGENQDANLKEDNELSGITGFDAITNMENYENDEESEAVSAEVLDNVEVPGVEDLVDPVEVQLDEEISDNVEVRGVEDSVGPVEAQLDEEISDNNEVPGVEDLVDPVEVQLDEEISDNVEVRGVADSVDPVEAQLGEEISDNNEVPGVEDLVDPAEAQMDEEISDDIDVPGVEDSVDPVNVRAKQSEGHVDVCISEIETTVQNSEELDVEIDVVGDSDEQVFIECKDNIAVDGDAELCEEKVEDDKVMGPEEIEDFNAALVKLTELRLQKEEDAQVVVSLPIEVADDIEEADHLAIGEQLKKSESDEVETADEEQASEAAVNDAVASEKNSPSKQLSGVKEEMVVVQQNKNFAMILSDNKENIGTGTKQIIKKERIKAPKNSGENLNDLSLRKLAKMFKEKLEISKKSSDEALRRAALQAKN